MRNLNTKGLEFTMKVLLIKDVYKLGRAGDVKKVADGYGRNFLLTKRLAVLATAGTLKTADKIRSQAEIRRTALNSELKGLADSVNGITLTFAAKAGETGKLYGSITTQDVATAIQEQTRYEVKRHQIDMQPIRELGEFKAHVRLTVDLVPEVKILVHREGEAAEAVPQDMAAAVEKPARVRRPKDESASEPEEPSEDTSTDQEE
jgi:large subunit ribosomal protein L9